MNQKSLNKGKGIKLEFNVKEDKFGNLIIHFIKDKLFKKGDNLFIYKPF